jgi:hypothetical protein
MNVLAVIDDDKTIELRSEAGLDELLALVQRMTGSKAFRGTAFVVRPE